MPRPNEPAPLLAHAHAELLSLGGAVIFSVCAVVTVGALMVIELSNANGIQVLIAVALTIAAWLYFFDSVGERLELRGHEIIERAFVSRTHVADVDDLVDIELIHQGFNLQRGILSLDFHFNDKRPERWPLGPCWQRHKLEAFLKDVEAAMDDPHALKEVR